MTDDINLALAKHFSKSTEVDPELALQMLVSKLSNSDKAALDELVKQQEEAGQMLEWRLEKERPELTQQKYLEFYNQGVAEMKQRLIPRWLPTNRYAVEKSARQDAETFVKQREQQSLQIAEKRWLKNRIALVENALSRDEKEKQTPELKDQFNQQQGDFEI